LRRIFDPLGALAGFVRSAFAFGVRPQSKARPSFRAAITDPFTEMAP
jgi:hypothetical protein